MKLVVEALIDSGGIDPSLIARSLAPDNIEIPEGISIDIKKRNGEIVVKLACESSKILTCRSTLDEILMLIDSIIKSLRKK